MRINEIVESSDLEPNEVRELFMEFVKEIDWLINNYSNTENLSVIDSKINFLKQWSDSCINEYTKQQLLDNPDVAFICNVGPKAVNVLQQRRQKL